VRPSNRSGVWTLCPARRRVSANETTDIFSPSHWSRCLANRGADLFLIYVLYIGSMCAVVMMCLPVILVVAMLSVKTILFTAALSGLFAGGAAVLLLGGLCGEFARVERQALVERQAPPPVVVRTGEAPVPPPTSRKPPLLDAGKRVAGADIAALEELREHHAPNPYLLHALSLAYAEDGRRDEAVSVAREGIPLAMKSGGVILAAEMFDAFRTDADFGIPREQVVAFADALRASKRLAASARLYVVAVASQPGDVRAEKGAIATAEEFVTAGDVRSALHLYNFLIEHCVGSPLLEFVRERRAEALKRL